VIETLPFVAILASALLHASWNAMARSGREPGDVLACGVMISGIVGLPGLLWFGPPASPSWLYLLVGVILNTIGVRLAMAAYRTASFGLAYPVMRAGIPLLTLPIGAVMLNEWPRPWGVAGVLLIAAALIMLALAARKVGRAEMRGLGFALTASVAGAGFVTADAVGVRVSGNVLGYAFAVTIGNGLSLALLTRLEGRNPLTLLPVHAARGLAISALSMTSFLLYISAVAVAPVALAAALRETSVLVAVAIARYVLKEDIGRFHWAAAALAVAGVIGIRLA
jgi:drug/metabolite transporter (DMT)-like permease